MASRLQDVIQRGLASARPAATAVAIGTLYYSTDTSITERSDGTVWESYSDTGVAPPPTPGSVASTFLVSGGQVTWDSSYTFRVSAADYYIDGTHYTSTEQTLSLTAADATNDRIDVIVLNTSGTALAITGTAASTPSEPSIDPAAYLKLAIVFVENATTSPPTISNVTVYAENAGTPTEWAFTSSGASIVVNSTTNPRTGTIDIEGTSVVAGVYVRGTGASAIDVNAYDHLRLFIRSKATWNNSRGLLVSLRNAGVLVGTTVQIKRTGTFGFDSSITATYQQVAIPITAFAVTAGTTIQQVQIEDFGGAIGFYIDDISFQANATTPVTGGITQDQADARYAPLVHASRHASAGADPVSVTGLAGYPGGTTTFLRADATFASAGGGGTGDVVGPSSASSTAIAIFDGTTGKLIKDGIVQIAAAGNLVYPGNIRQTFGPGSTTPGINVGSHTADPSIPSNGDLWYNSTNNTLNARINGANVALGGAVRRQVTIIIDGGGSAITTGLKTFVSLPAAGTWKKWRILSIDSAATSGSIVIDVWKDTYANYAPTVADTITASAKPTLSSTNKAESSTLTGWTTTFSAGDVLAFNVDSITTVTKVALYLEFE